MIHIYFFIFSLKYIFYKNWEGGGERSNLKKSQRKGRKKEEKFMKERTIFRRDIRLKKVNF